MRQDTEEQFKQHHALQYTTRKLQYKTKGDKPKQCNIRPDDLRQCKAIQYNISQYKTIQCKPA